jgi:hypothetical protein
MMKRTSCFVAALAFVLAAAVAAPAAQLLSLTITTALTAQVSPVLESRPGVAGLPAEAALIQANFTWGSGGTTVDAWVQTTLDGGGTWTDVCNFHFTTSSARAIANVSALTPVTTIYTPTDGSLSSNTCKDGIVGQQWRTKVTTTGTYAGGTTLQVNVVTGRLTTTTSP